MVNIYGRNTIEQLPYKFPYGDACLKVYFCVKLRFNSGVISTADDCSSQFFFCPSLAEIEKLYFIALNGTEVERPAAAKILCSASLSRGWYIQVINPIPS